MGDIEKITTKDIIAMILNGIKEYDYFEGEVFEDGITITTNSGKQIYINVELDKGEIEG